MQKSSSQSVPGIASAQVLCIEARYFVTFGILWPRLKPLTREPGVERNLYRRGGGGGAGGTALERELEEVGFQRRTWARIHGFT